MSNDIPLTIQDQMRIAQHEELQQRFFKKINFLSLPIFWLHAFLVYNNLLFTESGDQRHILVGLFIILPIFNHFVFKSVLRLNHKALHKNNVKKTVSGIFTGMEIQHHGKTTRHYIVIEDKQGNIEKIQLKGLLTIWSGQQDDVIEYIKQWQPGQNVTIDYLPDAHFILAAQ